MALNDVPLSGQTLGVTQPLIRNNFSTIDTAFTVDHVSYGTSGQGKHNQVTFPQQSSEPSFSSSEIGLYNFLVTANELYVKKGSNDGVPFTKSTKQAFSGGGVGETYLPSGIILKWGKQTAGANQLTTVTYSTGFPNNIIGIQLTQITKSETFSAKSPQLTVIQRIVPTLTPDNFQFVVNNNGAAVDFMWLAIGF